MPKYTFLSPEWIDEAKKIREEYRGRTQPITHSVRMNQVITDVPFGEGTLESHIDSTSGDLELDLGHLSEADLKVTMDYLTAKAILVEGNPQAGMQAFMSGKIRVEGDMTKLLAMQSAPPDATSLEIAGRIRDITEE